MAPSSPELGAWLLSRQRRLALGLGCALLLGDATRQATATDSTFLYWAGAADGTLLDSAAAVVGTVVPGKSKDPHQAPISLDAASSQVDYKTNTVVLKEVVISQGDMRVQADHARATGLDFDNSRWTFEGNVRIDAEQRGSLRSDQAIVEFRNNRIARATIEGSPAEFEQKRAKSEQMARGHAREIVYDVNDGTVRLSNDAWLSDGVNEISGPLLVYNIREQALQAAAQPGSDSRVHLKITPHSIEDPNKKP